MANKNKIEAGDIVDIHFDDEGGTFKDAVVVYVPVATGDAWHIRTRDGQLVYVQSYGTMYLERKYA